MNPLAPLYLPSLGLRQPHLRGPGHEAQEVQINLPVRQIRLRSEQEKPSQLHTEGRLL